MKTIGIIGGISWVSSVEYYRIINQTINDRLGGLQAAKLILFSLNYGDIKELTDQGNWERMASIVTNAAQKLENAGADCILIGANTMHKLADQIQAAINIPVLHIAEVVANRIAEQQLTTVALLGTKFTMEQDFYKNKLAKRGISVLIPEGEEREFIHFSIYNEMGKGIFSPETKKKYLAIISNLQNKGVQAIILGCTEIPMLIKQEDCTIPLLDTTTIHCLAGVDFALEEVYNSSVVSI